MKSKILILIPAFLIIFSCSKNNDLGHEISQSDYIALEGMKISYEFSFRYNDSLVMCANQSINCDAISMIRYDQLFHEYDDKFNTHHDAYSHDNYDDDHHHQGIHSVHHNWVNHHGMEHHGHPNSYGYAHNFETFELMIQLRELHHSVHP